MLLKLTWFALTNVQSWEGSLLKDNCFCDLGDLFSGELISGRANYQNFMVSTEHNIKKQPVIKD